MNGLNERANPKDAISSSWSRCERDYNLSRTATHPILKLQSTEVAPRLEAMNEKTGGRHGIFRKLAEVATGAGHCLVITDNEGILVRLESKDAGPEWNGISLGSVWDERVAGTNGVSMALAEGKSFTVRGCDHYYAKLQSFACTAVPLRDADNTIIGVANLSSIDRGNQNTAVFAQQLLKAAASRLQHTLFERTFKDQAIVSVAVPGRREFVRGNELVAVDEKGTILGTTKDTHLIAGLHSNADLKGKPFDAVFGADLESLERVPGRMVSVRRDRGPLLDLWTRTPVQKTKFFAGWKPAKTGPLQRRRLPPSIKDLATGSIAFAALCERAQNTLSYRLPLLIDGETGTGKSTLVSGLIGAATQTVVIDCASLEETVEDRAYVRAIMQQVRFAGTVGPDEAPGTALVFDNIDEMPTYVQSALRNLMDEIDKSNGDSQQRPLIIGTCRRPLLQAVASGAFRDDLYFMLAGAVITLPPLRTREGSIEIAKNLASALAGGDIFLTTDAQQAIASYDWPGNVWELRAVLQQALINGNGARISALDLGVSCKTNAASPALVSQPPASDEKQMVLDALHGARWNVSKAARVLGIGRATIHRKMKTYQINRPT